MPPTRQEVQSYLRTAQGESLGRPYIPGIDTALGMIKTAAVSFEHLTNNPDWDRFLSYVQGLIDETRKQRERALSLCAESIFDSEIRKAQIDYHRADGQIDVLEKVIALPVQFKDAWAGVKELKSEVHTQP